MGNNKFKIELERFVTTKLRNYFMKYYYLLDYDRYYSIEEHLFNYGYKEKFNNEELKIEESYKYPQLTNHEICHEMFWNAFRGRSKMFIQMSDLSKCNVFENNSAEVITLQCSLLTLQMVDYDIMMFNAMKNTEDEDYKNAAIRHYRPYFFSFVAEIEHKEYEELKKIQCRLKDKRSDFLDTEDEETPYIWMECTFYQTNKRSINLSGYVIQSASNIDKITTDLSIIEDENTDIKTIKRILDTYKLDSSCTKDDNKFIELLENSIGNKTISSIDVYKVGNGNCVFARTDNTNGGFFYDIGFNYRHRPMKITNGVTYNYSNTMRQIVKNNPSFYILSHWDMDHIAGISAAGKSFFDKDWFAPDCYDACTDAKRLAIYLDLKNNLYLVNRHCRNSNSSGRLIGRPIEIKDGTSKILATYKLYMGEKAGCDKSRTNCEGIVIEYKSYSKKKNQRKKVVIMMGDVNYTSFNKARNNNQEPLVADSQIDYLIAPHHGSQHTDYKELTSGKSLLNGELAIICCTNDTHCNRPNPDHLNELKKRFKVITTEEIKGRKVSEIIRL